MGLTQSTSTSPIEHVRSELLRDPSVCVTGVAGGNVSAVASHDNRVWLFDMVPNAHTIYRVNRSSEQVEPPADDAVDRAATAINQFEAVRDNGKASGSGVTQMHSLSIISHAKSAVICACR